MKIKALILTLFFVCYSAFAVISSSTNRNDYTGGGPGLDYTFKIFEDTHLLVTVVNTNDSGETTLVLGDDYSVTNVGNPNGGKVVLLGPSASKDWLEGTDPNFTLASGWEISIRRNVEIRQETDIRNQGTFFPSTHEDAFDYLVMIDQQQQDILDRGLIVGETAAGFNNTIEGALNANYFIVVNSTGTGFAAIDHTSDSFDLLAPTDSQGDLIVHTGSTNAKIPVGTASQVLIADPAQTEGMKWATVDMASLTPLTVSGDLMTTNGGDGDVAVLSVGAVGQVLTVSDSAPGLFWADNVGQETVSVDGDLLSFDSGSEFALPIGNTSQVLTVSGTGLPYWADAAAGGGTTSPLTTQGDLYIYDIDNDRLPIGTTSQVLTVSPSGLPIWATLPIEDGWSTPIVNTISADTTSPTKGTVVLDELLWRQNGQDYEVIMRYEQSVAGLPGDGEYIFTLPPGVQIDLAHYTAVTDLPTGNSEVWPKAIIGHGYVSSTIASYGAYATVYDTNSFKIQTDAVYPLGHDHMGFSLIVGYHIRLKFRGVGLEGASGGGVGSVDTEWADAGVVVVSATTTAPDKGASATVDKTWWRRQGDSMEIRYEFSSPNNGTSGSGDYLFRIPSGYQIDTTKLTPYSTVEGGTVYASQSDVGNWHSSSGDGGNMTGGVMVFDNTWVRFCGVNAFVDGCQGSTLLAFSADGAGHSFSANFTVPIVGWEVGGGSGGSSPLTTDGDLYYYNTQDERLPIGTTGQVLTVSSSGLPSWEASAGGGSGGLTLVAHGRYSSTGGCIWARSVNSWATPTDTDCPPITELYKADGYTIDLTDDESPTLVMTNLPAGHYRVSATAIINATSTATSCGVRISDGTNNGTARIVNPDDSSEGYTLEPILIASYPSSGTRTFGVQLNRGTGAGSCNFRNSTTWGLDMETEIILERYE